MVAHGHLAGHRVKCSGEFYRVEIPHAASAFAQKLRLTGQPAEASGRRRVQIRPWALVAVRKDPRVAQEQRRPAQTGKVAGATPATRTKLRPVEIELGGPFLECQPDKRAGPRC